MKKKKIKQEEKQEEGEEEGEEEKETFRLHIYSETDVEEYDTEEEAEDQKEYLERVQNKICSIEKSY